MKLRKANIVLLAAGVLAVWLGYHAFARYRVSRNFDRVSTGASKAEVVRALGTPWKVTKCGQLFGNPDQPGCAEEYLYKTLFAPLVPNYYSISFDSSGHVVDKYFYSSP